MRRVPVLMGGDHTKVIGWFVVNDTVSDKEIIESSVSWGYNGDTEEIIEMAIVPTLTEEGPS